MVEIKRYKGGSELPIWKLRRLLKGTGFEVDVYFRPARVSSKDATSSFVARGFATERAAARIWRKRGVADLFAFEEIQMPLNRLPGRARLSS